MQNRAVAVLLLIAGLALVALAVLVALGGLSWFGKLPGDIRVEGLIVAFDSVHLGLEQFQLLVQRCGGTGIHQ